MSANPGPVDSSSCPDNRVRRIQESGFEGGSGSSHGHHHGEFGKRFGEAPPALEERQVRKSRVFAYVTMLLPVEKLRLRLKCQYATFL